MVKRVHENISVSIKGHTFVLVWDADDTTSSACNRCALMGEVCKGSRDMSLLALCASMAEEPETYFIEDDHDITVHGINNQEIVTSALASLRDQCYRDGNRPRARAAQKLISQMP